MAEKPACIELENRIGMLESELKEKSEEIRKLSELNADLSDQNDKNKKIKKLFGLIEENIIDVIWSMDAEFNNTYSTPSIFNQRGYTVEEVTKQSLKERISENSLDYVIKLFAEKIDLMEKCDEKAWEPICFEMEQPCKDGSTVWTSNKVRVLKGEDDKPDGFIGTSHDITKRVLAEEKLKESEKKYRLLADNIADVIWTMDLDLNFTYISPSIFQQRGYTVEEAMTHKIEDLLKPESIKKLSDLYSRTLKKIEVGDPTGFDPILFETEQPRKDGSTIWIRNYARILKGPDNKPESILGISHDITMRKLAEEEKEKALKVAANNEKLALIGQIAGKIAHDFNNILGIIMGNTELLITDCKNPDFKKTLELVFEQTLRGRNLTKNLVAFAKSQEPKQEYFNITEKIDLVLNLLKKDLDGIEVKREDNTEIKQILADPGMIEHAVVNLIQNSIHATSLVKKPQITIKTFSSQKIIGFEIEDNGCGIPKEHIPNIYSPSFSLKGSMDITGSYRKGIKGTGYGLSNVEKYIKQHKGTISVKSETEKGTTFTITLPVINKELSEDEISELGEELMVTDRKILLVEDEIAVSDIQKRVLSQKPFNHMVDTAENGRSAIDLFEKNNYDLISLDYFLAGDLNGMDVYNYIREKDKKIQILFISGNIEFLESLKDMKQKDSRVLHLSKPCLNKDYINKISILLSQM